MSNGSVLGEIFLIVGAAIDRVFVSPDTSHTSTDKNNLLSRQIEQGRRCQFSGTQPADDLQMAITNYVLFSL